MARRSRSSNARHVKSIRGKKPHSDRSSLRTTKKVTSNPAPARATPVLDLKTSVKVINECRRQVKNAQRQIEILTERNIGLQKELADLTQKEAQVRHLAYHDELTGLPNRSLLLDRFQQAISQAERRHKPLALLLLDLNEFKLVNDKLGHGNGDKLLQAVALRLIGAIRGADTACRYGGDEFVIMLPETDNANFATALVGEIRERLRKPYILDGHEIHMAVSVGIAVYPSDGHTFNDLMKQADIAMYQNKSTGRSTSIIEQPKKDFGEADFFNPLTRKNVDHMPERDLSMQDESVHTQE